MATNLLFRPPGSQGRGDRITAPSQNVPEIHPTCAVGGTQTLLGLGPGRKFSQRRQKDAVAWRAASPRASSSPAHVFGGAASRTLAPGHDIKARAEDAQRSPCRPRLHCRAGLSIWSSGCKSALGASFPKPSDRAISCINANVRLLLGAGRCGHTSGLPVRPRAGRPPAPRPRCPQLCPLSPLASLALAELSEPRLEPERVCVSLRHPPSAFRSAGILLEVGRR